MKDLKMLLGDENVSRVYNCEHLIRMVSQSTVDKWKQEVLDIPESMYEEEKIVLTARLEEQICNAIVGTEDEIKAINLEVANIQKNYENNIIALFWNTNYGKDMLQIDWYQFCDSYKDRLTCLKRAGDVFIYAEGKKFSLYVSERAFNLRIDKDVDFNVVSNSSYDVNFFTAFQCKEPMANYSDKAVDENTPEFRMVYESIVRKHGMLNACSIDSDLTVWNGKNRFRALVTACDDGKVFTENEMKNIFNGLIMPINFLPKSLVTYGATECVGISRTFNSKAISQKGEKSSLALRIINAYVLEHKTQKQISEIFGISEFTVSEYVNIKDKIPLIKAMLNKRIYGRYDLTTYDAKINNIVKISKLLTNLGYSEKVVVPSRVETDILDLYIGKPISVTMAGYTKNCSDLTDYCENFVNYYADTMYTSDKLNSGVKASVPEQTVNSLNEYKKYLAETFPNISNIEELIEKACNIRFQLDDKGKEEKRASFLAKFKKASK